MRTPKEGIENEAETDKKVDEVRKAALFFMHLYMRTSKIPHLREAAFPFAEVTGTKSQDEGGNGAAPGPRPGLRFSPGFPTSPSSGDSQRAASRTPA